MKPQIHIKRVYEKPAERDGHRILVDRLWPRGLKKEEAELDEWAKELAPSTALRKWFDHDPKRWHEFRKKYRLELASNPAWDLFMQEHQDRKQITLLFSGKDEKHTHALVLKEHLEEAFGNQGD